MGVEEEDLKYFGAKTGFRRVPVRKRSKPIMPEDEGEDNCYLTFSHIKDVTLRYQELSKVVKFHVGFRDKDLVKARTDLWLLNMQAYLDGALGFDDNLGFVGECLHKLYCTLYRNFDNFHYDNTLDFECLRMVKQIVMAPDREWENIPAARHDKLSTFDQMRTFALFILYDHQSRTGDLDMAKNLADFLSHWGEVMT